MCRNLTVLAREDPNRCIGQCEHGTVQLVWDNLSIRLHPADFIRLAEFVCTKTGELFGLDENEGISLDMPTIGIRFPPGTLPVMRELMSLALLQMDKSAAMREASTVTHMTSGDSDPDHAIVLSELEGADTEDALRATSTGDLHGHVELAGQQKFGERLSSPVMVESVHESSIAALETSSEGCGCSACGEGRMCSGCGSDEAGNLMGWALTGKGCDGARQVRDRGSSG